MEVREVGRRQLKKLPREQYDAEIKKLRAESEKMVTGMFEFVDAPGGFFEFSYRFFPGEPMRSIKLQHGEITDLPMGIVKHLNNCTKKVRTLGVEQGKNGLLSSVQKFSRLKFTPVNWT